MSPAKLATLAGGADQVTLPRDNPVKDFLISADTKFAAFGADDRDFYGLLVVVWDDFIYEPITALIHPASGLLTENSFARTDDGHPLKFEHIDAILLVSHLQYLKWALAEDGNTRPFHLSDQSFRWNVDPARPAAYLETPHGRPMPQDVQSLLEARPLDAIPGAEYRPSDWINWINTRGPDT